MASDNDLDKMVKRISKILDTVDASAQTLKKLADSHTKEEVTDKRENPEDKLKKDLKEKKKKDDNSDLFSSNNKQTFLSSSQRKIFEAIGKIFAQSFSRYFIPQQPEFHTYKTKSITTTTPTSKIKFDKQTESSWLKKFLFLGLMLMDYLWNLLKGFLKTLKFDTVLTKIGGILKKIRDFFIGDDGVFTKIWGWIKDSKFVKSLVKTFHDIENSRFIKFIKNGIEKISSFFEEFYNVAKKIGKNKIISSLSKGISQISEWVSRIFEGIINATKGIGKIIGKIVDKFWKDFEIFGKVIGKFFKGFGVILEKIGKMIPGLDVIFSIIQNLFEVWNSKLPFWEKLIGGLTGSILTFFTLGMLSFKDIKGIFDDMNKIWGDKGSLFTKILKTVGRSLQAIPDLIVKLILNIGEFLSWIFRQEKLRQWFEDASKNFNLGKILSDVFSNIENWFKNTFSKLDFGKILTDFITKLFSILPEWIKNMFHGSEAVKNVPASRGKHIKAHDFVSRPNQQPVLFDSKDTLIGMKHDGGLGNTFQSINAHLEKVSEDIEDLVELIKQNVILSTKSNEQLKKISDKTGKKGNSVVNNVTNNKSSYSPQTDAISDFRTAFRSSV